MESQQFDPGILGEIEEDLPSPACHMEIQNAPVSLGQIFVDRNGTPAILTLTRNDGNVVILPPNTDYVNKFKNIKKRDLTAIIPDPSSSGEQADTRKMPRFTQESVPPSQNTNNMPLTPSSQFQTRNEYYSSDKGPFIVHVSLETQEPDSGAYLHPVKFGQFLFTNGVSKIKDGGIKKIGRNRISVEFTSAVGANSFLTSPLGSNKYKKFIPSYHISKTGIVRNIPTDYTNEEIPNLICQPHSE